MRYGGEAGGFVPEGADQPKEQGAAGKPAGAPQVSAFTEGGPSLVRRTGGPRPPGSAVRAEAPRGPAAPRVDRQAFADAQTASSAPADGARGDKVTNEPQNIFERKNAAALGGLPLESNGSETEDTGGGGEPSRGDVFTGAPRREDSGNHTANRTSENSGGSIAIPAEVIEPDSPPIAREGNEHKKVQEHGEVDEQLEIAHDQVPDAQHSDAGRQPALLAPRPVREAPGFLRRVEERVRDNQIADDVPDHELVAEERRSKIGKFAAKVAHHGSTKVKAALGTSLSIVGAANAAGIMTGTEGVVGAASIAATVGLGVLSVKTDFLPELMRPSTLGIIGTTAATATVAEVNINVLSTSSFTPLELTGTILGSGVAYLASGGKDVWNVKRFGSLIKKDAANSDREKLAKLQLGTPGVKGEKGTLYTEKGRREEALRNASNGYIELRDKYTQAYDAGDEKAQKKLGKQLGKAEHKVRGARGRYERVAYEIEAKKRGKTTSGKLAISEEKQHA